MEIYIRTPVPELLSTLKTKAASRDLTMLPSLQQQGLVAWSLYNKL